MATKEQVEAFLKRLKEKIKVFDIIFRDDRGKNLQTLATLEINTTIRKQVIMNIAFHIAEHKMNYPFKN